MDQLYLIKVFVAVVDAKGFAGAARKLSMSPPAVTRAINELESHLGVRLLIRTTRVVRVSEAGQRYAEDCRRILNELMEADESVSGMHAAAPRGKLTVTAPAMFGAKFITPIVTEYLRRYPQVNIDCWLQDRIVNMMDDGIDVAIRIGQLPDSTMQAIRVGQVRRVICASPSYLAEHGEPRTPQDLASHCTVIASSLTPVPEWRLVEQGETCTVKLQPRLTVSSNDAAVNAALEGFGIVRLMSYQVADYVSDGRLKILLAEFEPPMVPVHVLHREGRHASRKARAFLDLAIERLRANPVLD